MAIVQRNMPFEYWQMLRTIMRHLEWKFPKLEALTLFSLQWKRIRTSNQCSCRVSRPCMTCAEMPLMLNHLSILQTLQYFCKQELNRFDTDAHIARIGCKLITRFCRLQESRSVLLQANAASTLASNFQRNTRVTPVTVIVTKRWRRCNRKQSQPL